MIRLRSQKLLSGVSTLAVLATFGMVDPVLADTISGPGNVDAITTPDLTDLGPVTIDSDANVLSAGGRSFFNPLGTILAGGASTALTIEDSVLQGSITNAGSITSTLDAININDAIVKGGFINTGVLDVDGDGLELDEVVFSGGINNSGTIDAGGTGIYLDDDGIFTGGILNSGLIITGNDGIYIDTDWSFAGGINNTGTIDAGSEGISIDADSFSGGIANSGLITASDTGIYWNGSVFTGGINNTATGTIYSDGSYGIYLDGYDFAGGIVNAGQILAPSYYGIYADSDVNVFQGGISNTATGTISSLYTAISIYGDVFQGGITNAGQILSASSYGIYVSNGSFQGGINNTATGVISALDTAVSISNGTFSGGLTNAGVIQSTGNGYGVYVGSTLFDGGINNSGSILGNSGLAIYLSGTTFAGGVTNSGLIGSASSTALYISNSTFSGGINNSGSIVALDDGYGIYAGGTSFLGGITNSGLIQGGTNDTAIYISGSNFDGGITNSGRILSGSTAGYGIYINPSNAFSGGINNSGTISGDYSGIYVSGTTFEGGITNSGLIESRDGDYGIYISNTTFAGGIDNTANGVISGSYGVYVSNTTFTGGITNAGLIEGTSEYAIYISNTTFTGGINNSGTLSALDYTGVYIGSTTFEGGFTNSGLIDAGTSGVNISTTNFSGGFLNTSTGVIRTLEDYGVDISVSNWDGDFVNDGTILGATDSGSGDGVYLDADSFNGNFLNTGTIVGGLTGGSGVYLTGDLFAGDVTNSGLIQSLDTGLSLNNSLYTGDVTNSGDIVADAIGIYVDGGTTIAGALINSGLIDPSTGIYVDGEIQGGIFNSGTILGWNIGIDLSDADAAHTITQTAGLIQGNSLSDGTGTIEIALDLDNGFVDTFNANGGVLDGDVIGDGTDIFNVGGIFQYLRGTADDVAQLNVNSGVGTFGEGGLYGVEFNTLAFNINGGGTAIVGDLSLIDVANDFTVNDGGTLGFFLTTNEAVHGLVDVGGTAYLAGPLGTSDTTLLAVIDASTFASATTDYYYYFDVINGTIDNTFSNVTSSSLFWTADAFYGAGYVDIELNRVDFGDVLNQLGLIQTQNQQAIGNTLEEIFQDVQLNGPLLNEFDDLFAALFSTTDPDEILAMYDEINGSEHAQVQQTILTASGLFNTIVGDQMDRTLLTLDGARFANMGAQRYASAAAIMASDASAASVGGSHGLNRGASGAAIWARGFGQWTNTDSDPEAAGYDQDTSGVAGGVEFAINNNASLGGAVIYSTSDVDFDTPGDAAELDSWQVGFYGNYGFGNFYAGGSASYAWHDVATVRVIAPPVPGAPFVATAGYDASAWSVSGEVGGIWRLGRVNVQPSVGLSYTGADTDGFTETGNAGAYTLIVNGADADSFASILAVRASGLWTMGQTRVVPDIKLGWRHEFDDDRQSITAVFLGDPTETPFTIVSSEIQQDSALVSAGLTFGVTNNLEIFGDVNGLYNSDSSSTTASGGVRLTW